MHDPRLRAHERRGRRIPAAPALLIALGGSLLASTPARAATTPLPPLNLAAPSILDTSPAGAFMVGDVIEAAPGTWSPLPTSLTQSFERCDAGGNNCAPIGGATGHTYTLTAADAGTTLRVVETAVDLAGTSAPAVSPPSPVVQLLDTATGAVGSAGSTVATAGSRTPPLGGGIVGGTGTTTSGATAAGTTGSASAGTAAGGSTTAPSGARRAARSSSATPILGALVVRGNSVIAWVSCRSAAGSRCAATLVLTTTETVRGRNAAGDAQRRRVLLGRRGLRLRAGQRLRVRLTLNRTGRRLLARLHILPARLTLTRMVAGTPSVVATHRLRFTTPKAHRKH